MKRLLRPDPLLILGLFALCLICDFALARALQPNSDSVQNFNELDSIFAGHLLLGKWIIASDNFYLTDLPFYVLLRLVAGNGLWLIYTVPFIVFSLLLGCALVLTLRAPPRDHAQVAGAVALFCLIGIPASPHLFMLLVSDFHAATILFSLAAIACSIPALYGLTMRPLRYAAFALAGFIATASDPMADVLLLIPLLCFIALQPFLGRRLARPQLILAGCTIAVMVYAWMFPRIIELHGGFYSRASYSTQPVTSVQQILSNAHAVVAALALLFEAQGAAVPLATPHAILRAAVAVLVLLSTLRTLLRLRRDSPALPQLLVLCGLCLCAACAVSTSFAAAVTPGPGYPNAATRYVAPAYVFFGIAAAIELKSILAIYPARGIRLAGASGAAFLLGIGLLASLPRLAAPAGIYTSPAYGLAQWLQTRNLTYGVGDYYTTQLIRALSQGQVMADPMIIADGRLAPDYFWTDTTRFDNHTPPQFVIYPHPNWFNLTRADVLRTYGPPSGEAQLGTVTILLYQH